MKTLLFVFSVIATQSTQALTLEGRDRRFGTFCSITFLESGFDVENSTSPRDFYALATTNYAHGADRPAPFRLKFAEGRTDRLVAVQNEGRDRLVVAVDPVEPLQLSRATAFSLTWWHVNHAHTNQCNDLRVK